MDKNRFGLARHIPNDVKKTVRRRCGFGCVICGNAIHTYEHIVPFAEVAAHDPKDITLLCGDHQTQSTKGILSKETIRHTDSNPYCLRVGHAKHPFDLGNVRPKLFIGKNNFTECGPKIEFDGETLFEVFPPERKSSLWRVSARFRDRAGNVVCEIEKNELLVGIGNVDFRQVGKTFSILAPDGQTVELESHPPNALLLTRYEMMSSKGTITIGEEDFPLPLDRTKHEMKPMLTFVTDTSRVTFVSSTFISPDGIILRFANGGLQFSNR